MVIYQLMHSFADGDVVYGGMLMKHYIGTWSKESENIQEVAELIIDGNQIEFYRRDYGEVFPCAFIGSDGEHCYKVFTSGRCSVGQNRTLEMSTSYRTSFVLQQNCTFPNGNNIENIKECSFVIPELIDWLGIKTVDMAITENEEMFAMEFKLPPIVLHKLAPHVEIQFESESFTSTLYTDSRTTYIIKNQPRICINYEDTVDVHQLQEDIETIMQFWGLMIGCVSNVEDIRLSIDGQSMKSWLYINRDYSYNLRTKGIIEKPRTTLRKIDTHVTDYFSNWYSFCRDDKFESIRRMYFSGNNRKDIFAEDILVLYVKILEGYHLRISGDETISEELKKAFKEVEKDIWKLIFADEGKPLFTAALEKVVPDWKYNSSHAKNIAQWIATGYLGKVGLAQRIKALDESFWGVVSKNAVGIKSLSRNNPPAADEQEEKLIEQFYGEIVATRNYYSHFKAERKNVLEFRQMTDTINVLKALLIMIFYSHMGMEKAIIRKIIMWDSELHFQTMCLREDGEHPEDPLFEVAEEIPVKIENNNCLVRFFRRLFKGIIKDN